MKELELLKRWIDALKRSAARRHLFCDVWRIETESTMIGVPDAFVMIENTSVWLEAKRCAAKDGRFIGKIELRPMQMRRLDELRRSGQLAKILLLADNDTFSLIEKDVFSERPFAYDFKDAYDVLRWTL